LLYLLSVLADLLFAIVSGLRRSSLLTGLNSSPAFAVASFYL
jgi:hypothetical protein